MIKAVLFDLDRTLVNINYAEEVALEYLHKNFLEKDTSLLDFIHTYKIENEKWWLLRSQEKASLDDIRLNSFRDTLKKLEVNIPVSLKEFSNNYIRKAELHLKLYDHVIHMLHQLKKEKIKTAIITNGFSIVQRPKIKKLLLEPYFDFICISDEVNLTKPNRKIFDLTLSKLAIANIDAIYIGDSLEDDYQGAINAKLQFLWFNENNKSNPTGVPEFNSYKNFIHELS